MSKGLKALEILYPNKTNEPYYTRSERRNACRIIEKELKALEIIKKELCLSVKSGLGEDGSIERYLLFANLMMKKIDQEEFDLLKEVLK